MSVAREIEYALLERIRSGQYAVGSRLPSVRDLAREFGVNKNTIASVSSGLISQGYLRSVAGKGLYVCEVPAEGTASRKALEVLEDEAAQAVWRAKMVGLGAAEVAAVLDRVLAQAYSPDEVRLVFIECNEYDAVTLGRQIEAGVGVPIRPLLLNHVLEDPRSLDDVDIAVTTFYHLAELRSHLAGRPRAIDVVGVHAPPDTDSLLRIARAAHGSRVLAVCTEETTLVTIVNQVRAYNPGLHVETFLVGRDGDLSRRLASVNYAIDTSTAHQAVLDAGCTVPVITLSFSVDSQSLDFLRGKIEQHFTRTVGDAGRAMLLSGHGSRTT